MEVPRTTEIAVVGAGAIGASAALQLALAGREVLLLDRGAVGQGASAGTACLITPSHAERLANPEALKEGIRFLPDPAGPLAIRPHLEACCRGWRASRPPRSVRHGVVARRHRRCCGAPRSRASSCTASGRRRTRRASSSTACSNVWSTEAGDEHRRRWAERAPRRRHRGAAARRRRGARARAARPRRQRYGSLYPGDAHVDSLGVRAGRGARRRDRRRPRAHRRRHAAARAEGVRRCPARHDGRARSGASQVVVAAGVWSSTPGARRRRLLPMWPAKGYHVEYAGDPGAAPARSSWARAASSRRRSRGPRPPGRHARVRRRSRQPSTTGASTRSAGRRRVAGRARRRDAKRGLARAAAGHRRRHADGRPRAGTTSASSSRPATPCSASRWRRSRPLWVERLARGEDLDAELDAARARPVPRPPVAPAVSAARDRARLARSRAPTTTSRCSATLVAADDRPVAATPRWSGGSARRRTTIAGHLLYGSGAGPADLLPLRHGLGGRRRRERAADDRAGRHAPTGRARRT